MIRHASRLAVLVLALVACVVLWDRFGPRPEAPPLDPGTAQVDRLVIEKAARRLTAYRDGTAVLTYDIALGGSPAGDKMREGDGRTPEGLFRIDRRNGRSAFHLSLGIDYPRPEDRARAEADGDDPGGDIFIHGQPNGLAGIITLPGDWTEGCIALSNAEIETLWRIVPIGTEVDIRP